MAEAETQTSPGNSLIPCLTRRRFLFLSASAIAVMMLDDVVPGMLFKAELASYERTRVGSLSTLQTGAPQEFHYPFDHPGALNYLVKLGVPAAGGVGPESDIVAYNITCPHMGFSLAGTYKPEYQAMGPCGWHFSTYDLTRRGMVISGHATQGLPQVVLETSGDDIYATGILGLMFGFSDNQIIPAS